MTEASAAPTPEEVRAQTEQFMQLLKDLRADSSPEAQRLRQALIETIASYDPKADSEQSRIEIVARLMGIEAGIVELLLRTLQGLRERLYKEGKRLGTASPQGKSVKTMSRALETMTDGLQQMLDAIAEGDATLRQNAVKRFDEAKKQLQAIGMK